MLSANETFREKCENFRSHFTNLSTKINQAKFGENAKIFSRNLGNSLPFLSFRIILVLLALDFILCFKKKDLNGRESIFKQIYVSQSFLNLYLFFCVNPSIALADKSLFENFRFFCERTKCENEAESFAKFFFREKTIFPFRWKPYLGCIRYLKLLRFFESNR